MNGWLILTATLPTSPSALRVKVWRALKSTHCATLREGVYILPTQAPTAQAFSVLDEAIRDAGAQSYLLEVPARDEAQEAAFRSLFDRSDWYADFRQSLQEARKHATAQSEAQVRKVLRGLSQQLQSILDGDFFPTDAAKQAQVALKAWWLEQERRWSADEPASQDIPVPRLDIADFQGRTWVTRARPWVDRLATAWLITRFVDGSPRFRWLRDVSRAPKGALGFDHDGARFTHVGDRVTFEVVAESFGLDDRPGLRRLGELVHVIDVGGSPQDEAPGLELMVRGLQALHADDDALLAAALPLFDTLLAGLARSPD